ncbi:unnamed protein product [Prorocentrum cordatum]|uniref:Uncharacterized protein n=1 Tax=Prorocentrum cordatum TaxID=2364126 RepID=A0ABN9TSX1_9DINO|nr:unnamed protein product [Polarella glacialis]
MIMREKEFERRLEAFNAQWNKLQPVVDGLKKDAAFLKQTAESHDASIHGVQRGQQNLTECVDSLHAAHAKMSVELDAAQRALKQTSQAVAVTQDNLGQNASFANNLHSRIDRAAAELSSTTGQLRALEGKHEALSDVVDKAVEKQGQLVSESRKEAQEVARVQRCLDTTNDSMASMAKQLEVMNRGLNGFKGELGFATDRVTKTEHSVKELYGAWHGLQKGFVDSGQDMGPSLASKRTGRLPKVGSPSAGSTMAGTPRTRDRLAFFPGGDGTTSQEAWGASPMSSRAVTKDSC